jgi:cytoskeleton-associated protein 5
LLSDLDLFLIILKKYTKDFKDANLPLNKAIFTFLFFLDSLTPKPYSRKSFGPMCKFLVERMGDAKFKDDISKLLES